MFHVKRRAAALCALLLALSGCAPAQPLERTFFAMDTVMTLRLYQGGDETLLDAAQGRVEELEGAGDLSRLLRPVERCFSEPSVTISGAALKRARNGNPFPLEQPPGRYKVFDQAGEFLLLGQCDGRECKIIKSFYEVGQP